MKRKEYINPFSEQAQKYASKFDEATIVGDIGELEKLLDEVEEQLPNEDIISQAQLYYSIGTVYSDFAKARGVSIEESFRKQIYCFRRSIEIIENNEYEEIYVPYIIAFKINLYTNYANTLSYCGRKIEAARQYKVVLNIVPTFGMALGNLGKLYMDYSVVEFDEGHQVYFQHFAYGLLKKALACENPNTHAEAKTCFRTLLERYSQNDRTNFLEKELSIPKVTYDDIEERKYRKWAIEKGLFLNTLNDLPNVEMCFAADVLQLPDMIVNVNDKPIFHGMFNQIKQEYVYARYQYYCSLCILDKPHFADKETYLLNFADYPQYGMRIEQLKSSFKILYGLFDKMAYFLNSYFDIGMQERDVSFRHIWLSEFGKGKRRYDYKNILNWQENFALASLYWISRDFYDSFEDSPNPQLKRICDVRNALEHKYVKVTMGWFEERLNGEEDDLALYIAEEELSKLTLSLMRIVRESIICLSLCVHIEEEMRKRKSGDKLAMPIRLMEYDDEWKI